MSIRVAYVCDRCGCETWQQTRYHELPSLPHGWISLRRSPGSPSDCYCPVCSERFEAQCGMMGANARKREHARRTKRGLIHSLPKVSP